ncbi:glycosyltransferase family 2 protein [Candidatus Saccharibacteria bacterium]|nr:glycosyltransferase family 2 protein [Candidatus Saccharibacteria bacterium]
MNKNPNVLIVILNFNGWEETLTCVDAVLKQTYKDFHIYLIENGSKDESIKKLKGFEDHQKITYIKNPKNLGFAGGVNQGITHAIENDYEYVALLNNDAIVDKDWLKQLVATSKKVGSSATTGLLLDGPGKKIESTGDCYCDWGLPFPRQREEDVSNALESGFVFSGTAGASLYTTELFRDIGLFDETFFAYFEDTDIGFRAQLAGHKAYYEKGALAYHDHGTTSSKMPGFTVYQSFKNLPLFFWKNVPLSMLFIIGIRFFACYALMYVRAVLRGQFSYATKGALHSLTLLPHAIKERYRIQKNKRVTSAYLKTIVYRGLPPNNKRYVRRVFHR